MDTGSYREEYEALLAASTQDTTGGRDLLASLQDPAGDTAERVSALEAVAVRAASDDAALDALLTILTDASQPVELRRAALGGLEGNSFRTGKFQSRRAEFTAALKQVMDDPDEQLRERSVEILAVQKDVDLQRRLIEGLRDESVAIVPPQRSVELLGYDPKPDYFDVLRDVVQAHADPGTRREAIRLLATDQGSRELIDGVVRDKEEPVALREAGAAALQAMAPQEFEQTAQDIVMDDDDDDELRAVVLAKLSYQDAGRPSDEFRSRVVSERDRPEASTPLQRAAAHYTKQRGID
jgi:HEAT repeat protein